MTTNSTNSDSSYSTFDSTSSPSNQHFRSPLFPVATRESPSIPVSHDILAGFFGGFLTVLVGHPLDTMKVRLQTSFVSPSLLSCIVNTWRNEGIHGFYKGALSPMIGEAFFNSVQFPIYSRWKTQIKKWRSNEENFQMNINYNNNSNPVSDSPMTFSECFLAGLLTGIPCAFVDCPVELFKSQLQTQIYSARPLFQPTFISCVSHVTRLNGLAGWFHGLSATLCRSVPATACYFGAYEATKSYLIKPDKSNEIWSILCAGSIGGVSYWTSCFPMDCVKSAIQSDSIEKENRKYHSLIDCWKQLYRDGGIRRFYRGFLPCIIRAAPANAACFLGYEFMLKFMKII